MLSLVDALDTLEQSPVVDDRCEMIVLDLSGDTKIMWDKNKPDEIKNARKQFDKWKAKGYLAYAVKTATGGKGGLMGDFDEKASKMILAPPMVAG